MIELPEVAGDVWIFQAGTAHNSRGELVTAGGRVAAVTAIAESLYDAAEHSRAVAEEISFKGKQLRRDIAWRELTRGARIT
mgnify:CR=1 FL=1